MPYALDQEALDSPNLKVLDINKPPVKQIPHEEFPKMVFLHPKDKTREHKTRVVADRREMNEALAQGWKAKPHVPENPPPPDAGDYEYEVAEVRRGPGRPRIEAE